MNKLNHILLAVLLAMLIIAIPFVLLLLTYQHRRGDVRAHR